jgi:putative endonuclease
MSSSGNNPEPPRPANRRSARFWIYMLECENGHYYTGISTNLARRYRQHLSGRGGVRYTRSFRPRRIAQCWRLVAPIGTVLKIELFIKRKSRAFKTSLIADPRLLKPALTAALGMKPRLYTFPPRVVEQESMRLTERVLREGKDPLFRFPLKNL